MEGTWVDMFKSPVVIKRRQNMIIICGLVATMSPRKSEFYFLKGYTEALLSSYFKRPVRVELQAVQRKNEMVVKWI